MEDREIVNLFWQRSEEAVVQTQEKYERYCSEISWHVLRSREDVRECVNDTWMQTWNSIPVNRPESLKAYVGRIVRNLSLNRQKHEQRKKRGGGQISAVYEELAEMIGQEDTVAAHVEKQAFLEFLTAFLGKLGRKERDFFVLRFWYLHSPREIAAQFGMREKEVYNCLYRIRQQFRKAWEEENRQ